MSTRSISRARLNNHTWWHQGVWQFCVIGSMGIAFDGERLRIAYVGPGLGQGAARRERKAQA